MDAEKMQMFVERYLELSGELKYRKGESGAYMQLGKLVAQKVCKSVFNFNKITGRL